MFKSIENLNVRGYKKKKKILRSLKKHYTIYEKV